MSTCFDVYTLPSGCDLVWTYPSAVHPHGGGVRPYGPGRRIKVEYPPTRPLLEDDDLAIALSLLLLD